MLGITLATTTKDLVFFSCNIHIRQKMQKKPFLRVFYSDTEPKPKIILERCNSCCQHDKQTKTYFMILWTKKSVNRTLLTCCSSSDGLRQCRARWGKTRWPRTEFPSEEELWKSPHPPSPYVPKIIEKRAPMLVQIIRGVFLGARALHVLNC